MTGYEEVAELMDDDSLDAFLRLCDKVEGEGRIKLVFKAPEQKPTPSPATGDTSSIDFFMVTGVVSVLGLGACLLLRKKKENE